MTCLLVFAATGHSPAQDESPPIVPSAQGNSQDQDTNITGSLSELMARIGEAHELLRPGLRASLLRQAQQSVPFVVIVDDAPSYLYAISQWEAMVRFPVLWDDGRVETHEHIARFVRAYKPDRVLRLSDNGAWAWDRERSARQRWIELALSKAMNEQSDDWRATLKSLHDQGVVSPGVVLTDAGDDAWAGALALAAGRMQPIGFMTRPGTISPPLEPDSADMIERAAERVASLTGRAWDTLGDEIDAVTLAMNTGTQIKTGPGDRDRIATSDRIGRREHNGAGERWAYCGQLIGSEAQSVYRAMCGLFLEIDQAFIWDGYESGVPWSQFDGTQAGQALEEAGLRVEVNDVPKNEINYWFQRGVRPVGDSAGGPGSSLLFLMNSKGAWSRYDLPGSFSEEGRPGDMPILRLPAALQLVHSFSLQRPYERKSVGGRLLERGVYVYAGSVDEPFLSGFYPTPLVAKRLAAGVAFGAAVRYTKSDIPPGQQGFNPSNVWKIAVLGDPLVTVGPAGKRLQADLLIDHLVDLDEQVKSDIKGGEYTNAVRDLVLLGRDEDAVRLAAALIRDKPEAFTPAMALCVMPAMQRTGDYVAMVDCYERMDNAGRKDPLMQDLLWLSSPYLLARGGQDASLLARVEALLRDNLRAGQEMSDAERLAMHLRTRSLDAALGVMESLRQGLNENQTRMLERAIARVKR